MPQCKFCKTTIVWRRENGRWIPSDPTLNARHSCANPPPNDVPEATQVPPIEDVEAQDYTNKSRLELQRIANERKLRPDATTGKGFSTWRAGASRETLVSTLEANDRGETLTADMKDDETSIPKGDLAAMIAAAVSPLIQNNATIDAEAVRAIVQEEMKDVRPSSVNVTVTNPEGIAIDVGRQHPKFPLLVTLLSRRKNVWLAGPAGSGKTTAAHNAAKALSLEFGAMSIGPQSTQSAIFGYMDAGGTYRETEFRRRYENGGVFLLDEIDRGNPGVLTVLNQAIENGACAFPDGMIPRHKDFVLVACANTFGTGASREYVGALQLDAATLDRFCFVAWPYDNALESDIAVAAAIAAGGNDTDARNWIDYIRKCRENVSRLGLRHVVSPRASIHGAELLAAGLDRATVVAMLVHKGLDSDTIAKIEG